MQSFQTFPLQINISIKVGKFSKVLEYGSRIIVNEGLDISFERGLIEINKDKLYLHFLPGFVSKAPF
ncbi:hypothetical protein N8224_06970, partial [Gammaproteobacteria bacterium]|nr:hypothetical protein [Gammaproteobacteria bacterium]